MFDETAYKQEYSKQHYDVIRCTIPKGKKAALQEIAAQEKTSVSACIVKALEYYYNIDLSSKE